MTTPATILARGAAGALAVLPSAAWAQCAMCQASLANAEGGGSVIVGFRQGVGLLLGVMGVLGVLGWKMVRRARAEFEMRNSQHRNEVSAPNSCLPAESSASR